MSVIEIESLTKRYDDVYAVRDLTVRVDRGEVFGFLGPNGAGKSTTIDILLDYVRRTSGEVSVLGHDPAEEPRAVRSRVGVVPQASGYYESITGRRHVEFAVRMKRANNDPSQLVERVGLDAAADRPVGEYSTGMRQRLGIALALVGQPEVLILDEPLSGLDPDGARTVRQVVRGERDRGATVFLSSHIMDQVETLCDRIGIMSNGRLVARGTVTELRRSFDIDETVTLTARGVSPDAVKSVDGVTGVSRSGDTLRIECRNAITAGRVTARIDGTGGELTAVETDETPLETLFFAATNEETHVEGQP